MAEPRGMRPFHAAGPRAAEVPAGAAHPVRPAPDVPGCGGGGQVHPWVPGTCRPLPPHPALRAHAGPGRLSRRPCAGPRRGPPRPSRLRGPRLQPLHGVPSRRKQLKRRGSALGRNDFNPGDRLISLRKGSEVLSLDRFSFFMALILTL